MPELQLEAGVEGLTCEDFHVDPLTGIEYPCFVEGDHAQGAFGISHAHGKWSWWDHSGRFTFKSVKYDLTPCECHGYWGAYPLASEGFVCYSVNMTNNEDAVTTATKAYAVAKANRQIPGLNAVDFDDLMSRPLTQELVPIMNDILESGIVETDSSNFKMSDRYHK